MLYKQVTYNNHYHSHYYQQQPIPARMSNFPPRTRSPKKHSQQQQQKQSSIVKSIIYGNILQTSYGMVRALCSAIGSKDHIDKIVLYLRSNHNFLKYNKYVYAFRLQHIQSQIFITENFNGRQKFLQGYNDDNGFDGVGEKLLALLQKFNVRNVLVVLAIRQRDPLKQIYHESYVEMVKCAKELLSSLYDKVLHSKSQQPLFTKTQQQIKQPIEQKQFIFPIQQFIKTQKPPLNPNYVGIQYIKKPPTKSLQTTHNGQIQFLNQKIKQLAAILEQTIQQFGQTQDTQAKFAIKYDQNKRVQKVFEMLAILFDLKSKFSFLQQSISKYLRSITSRNLTSNIIRRLNQQIMSDRSLRSQIIIEENQVCGKLMEFIQVLLKSYGFAKKLALIESEIEEASKMQTSNKIQSGTLKGSQKIINY